MSEGPRDSARGPTAAASGPPPEAGGTNGRRDARGGPSSEGTGHSQVLPDRAGEDLDRGWGDRLGSEEEERLLGERPPHWER